MFPCSKIHVKREKGAGFLLFGGWQEAKQKRKATWEAVKENRGENSEKAISGCFFSLAGKEEGEAGTV